MNNFREISARLVFPLVAQDKLLRTYYRDLVKNEG